MQQVEVLLGDRGYSINIGSGILGGAGEECRRLGLGKRCAVISDEHVAPLYADTVMDSLAGAGFEPFSIIVPAGEGTKNLRQAADCYNRLAGRRLERSSFILALGGGVVGDLAGFIAATYLRGVHFVQVPTSLLAQVDSSVGGKVGVNLPAGKNLVGAFYQPKLVVCDLDAFNTLPKREFVAGLAEVIKYGVISDPRFFDWLEANIDGILGLDPRLMGYMVAVCCRIKADVVGKDEKEGGLRAILNFGHTIGHAIEAITNYGEFLHGEAVAIGQAMAARLSREQCGLSDADADRIVRLLESAGLPTSVKLDSGQRRALFEAMTLDKKVSGGRVGFVLAPEIGRVVRNQVVPAETIENALREA
ncbi:MAG: 3-dehydroquinate synthase [Verrucomicrobia bacterium]|nr:3-dehydroquinate synthase [Verrucomicrobiota bacterium]MCF7708286.1 3-dehydroquinate synthase [Verrucomicrobiota bacterium]